MSTPYEEGLGGNGDIARCMVMALPKHGGRAVRNAEDITDDTVMVVALQCLTLRKRICVEAAEVVSEHVGGAITECALCN